MSIDVSGLSGKELHELEQQIAARRESEKEEKERLKAVKANYQLHLPEAKDLPYGINTYSALRSIAHRLSTLDATLTKDDIPELLRAVVTVEDINLTKVYECPHCGKVGWLVVEQECLGHGRYGEDRYGKYSLVCRHCDWEAPGKAKGDYPKEMWGHFHDWLIAKGFLPKDTEKALVTIETSFEQYLRDNPFLIFDRLNS